MTTKLDQLFSRIAHEQDTMLVSSERRGLVRRRLAGRARVHSRVHWRAAAVVIGCSAALTAVATYMFIVRHPPSLTAVVGSEQTRVSSGTWLDAPDTSSLPLRFSDGTRVEVAPRARIRLFELRANGAELELESGRAGLDVVHGLGRKWKLRAGPFLVLVTGTHFDVTWNPGRDEFELVLYEGQVELSGCGFGAGQKLVSGQVVRASCRDESVEVAFHRLSASVTPVVSAAPFPSVALPTEREPDRTSDARLLEQGTGASESAPNAAVTATVQIDWQALAREGRYKEALGAVDRLGFRGECDRVDAAGLALLAETARHANQPMKAREAYLALRRRFAGTNQAAVAAFSLGLLEFEQWHAYGKAAEWFRACLKERPRGPLVREARGRLMESLQRSSSDDAAVVAEDYLRDYPSGPHADAARRIVQSR